METGRAVWVTVKGNDTLQKWIMEDTSSWPVAASNEMGKLFEASLATHLIYFNSCEQNWRWWIRWMEERIRKSLLNAKTIPVETEPHFTGVDQKTKTGFSESSTGGGLETRRMSTLGSEKRGIIHSTTRIFRRSPPATATEDDNDPVSEWQRQTDDELEPEGMLILNMFSYSDLQTLTNLSEKIEDVTLAVQLNIRALQDVYRYYESLARSDELGEKLKPSIEKSLANFLPRVARIISNLETRRMQLLSLRRRLDGGKNLVCSHPSSLQSASPFTDPFAV